MYVFLLMCAGTDSRCEQVSKPIVVQFFSQCLYIFLCVHAESESHFDQGPRYQMCETLNKYIYVISFFCTRTRLHKWNAMRVISLRLSASSTVLELLRVRVYALGLNRCMQECH